MPVERHETLGDLIHSIRRDRGYTQKELAKLVGTSNSHISKWEANSNAPTDEYLQKLAKELKVPVEILYRKKKKDEMIKAGIVSEPMTTYPASKSEMIRNLEASVHFIQKTIEKLKDEEDL